jgi:hypothetical protein
MAMIWLAARLGAASGDSETVVETVANERFIGHVVQENAESVRFDSTTLGEITIPRAKIKSMTIAGKAAGGLTAAPAVVATPPAPSPAPAAPAAKSALREFFHLPANATASIAAGANVKAGVVDMQGYTVSLTFGYNSAKNVFNSVFQYEYSKAGSIVAADDFYLDSLLQHNLGEKTFVLVGGRYRQDKVQAIDHELTAFVAPGLYVTKTPRFEFGFAGGLSELVQDYGSTSPGAPDPPVTRDLGVAAYQFLQFNVLPRVQIVQNNLFTHSVEHGGKYIYRFLLSANLSLTDHFSLINMFAHGYDSQPAAGVGKSQDALTSQLSYRF